MNNDSEDQADNNAECENGEEKSVETKEATRKIVRVLTVSFLLFFFDFHGYPQRTLEFAFSKSLGIGLE